MPNSDRICDEVSKNDKFRIGIYGYNNKNRYDTYVNATNGCTNSSHYTDEMTIVEKTEGNDYSSWTVFGRGPILKKCEIQ